MGSALSYPPISALPVVSGLLSLITPAFAVVPPISKAIAARMLDGEKPAGGLHHEKIAAEALLLEVLLQLRQILCYARTDIGIGDHRGGSLTFSILLGKLVRSRHEDIGQLLTDQFLHSDLMRRISIGVKKQDRHRLDTALLQRSGKRADGILVQLFVYPPVRKKPLAHFETGGSLYQRCMLGKEQVVGIRAIDAPDLVDVTKAFGNEQSRFCSISLQQRVDGDC